MSAASTTTAERTSMPSSTMIPIAEKYTRSPTTALLAPSVAVTMRYSPSRMPADRIAMAIQMATVMACPPGRGS